ncbi:MAG: acetyl esterase/lipase [Kiritimatiellia bacterium]|jgi:acetyl esterase/lipase
MKKRIAYLAAILLTTGLIETETQVMKDLAYDDDHEAQKLDVYLAHPAKPAPVMVFIHGGGWRGGSKQHLPGFLRKAHTEGHP